MKNDKLENRLRTCGVLIICGLLVELISLKWAHPTSFLLFVIVGGLFMAAGMLFYLVSLVASEKPAEKTASEPVREPHADVTV